MQTKTRLDELNAQDLLTAYRQGELSPVEVVDDALARIERHNPRVNAYCHVDPDGARAAARASEARWRAGCPCGPLDGVPASIKDLTFARGMPTRKGSRTQVAEGPWQEDAPWSAAVRTAGAVLLGKTTTPEFGWKGVTDSPLQGITRNPWDTRLTSGGSSGGAAVAAALNLGVLHQGSDAGGSIRIPCAFTGTFGIKPTFGYIPQWPSSAMTLLSHLGPVTRSVADARLLLEVVAQPDRRDGLATAPRERPWSTHAPDLSGLRIAFSRTLGYVKVDADIARVVEDAVRVLADLGARVEEIDPGFTDPLETFNTLWFAGAARLVSQLDAAQRALLDPGLARIADAGQRITLPVYQAALEQRAALIAQLNAFHHDYDALVTPMLPLSAFAAGHDVPPQGPYQQWMEWTPFSYPFNLTQQPAASVPCGFTAAGLPVGLQVVAGRYQDQVVMDICERFQHARPMPYPTLE